MRLTDAMDGQKGADGMKSKWRRRLAILFFLLYIFTVLWFTVLKRSGNNQAVRLEAFWAIKSWLRGNTKSGELLMANIAMFIPFGFLLSSVCQIGGSGLNRSRKQAAAVIVAAAAFSFIIEILQFVLLRGLFELDDLIANITGALIGFCLYMFLKKMTDEKTFSAVNCAIGIVFMVVCAAVVYQDRGVIYLDESNTPRAFCFQIEEATCDEDSRRLEINGFAMLFGRENVPFSLLLKPTEAGKRIKPSIKYGLPRPSVNDYFLCDVNYTAVGFNATADDIDSSTEYEVLIRWPWSIPFSTGVFLTGEKIHYYPEKAFYPPAAAGTELEKIVNNGILRVFRPDVHCWVYQKDNALYWIADPYFNFKDDGKTYMQYQLWTTQTENLPEKRLAHQNYWDNIGGYFEEHELTGDFGAYRVSRREFPTAYAITSIVTGYFEQGKWIWKQYFRPVYSFQHEQS